MPKAELETKYYCVLLSAILSACVIALLVACFAEWPLLLELHWLKFFISFNVTYIFRQEIVIIYQELISNKQLMRSVWVACCCSAVGFGCSMFHAAHTSLSKCFYNFNFRQTLIPANRGACSASSASPFGCSFRALLLLLGCLAEWHLPAGSLTYMTLTCRGMCVRVVVCDVRVLCIWPLQAVGDLDASLTKDVWLSFTPT